MDRLRISLSELLYKNYTEEKIFFHFIFGGQFGFNFMKAT